MSEKAPGPSLTFYLLVLGLLTLIALAFGEVLARWEQGRVSPFRDLEPGLTAQEVARRVGETEYKYTSDEELREAAEGWNLLCHGFGQTVPGDLGVWDRSHRYYDGVEAELKPLPSIIGRVDLYRPAFLHAIMIYFDPQEVVVRVLTCAP